MKLPQFHGGTKLTRSLNRGAPKPEATTAPYHAGSGAPKKLHDAPSPGSAVNRGGTFGMGTLKRK